MKCNWRGKEMGTEIFPEYATVWNEDHTASMTIMPEYSLHDASKRIHERSDATIRPECRILLLKKMIAGMRRYAD